MTSKGKQIGFNLLQGLFKSGGITPSNQGEKQLADSSPSGEEMIESEFDALDNGDYWRDAVEEKTADLPGFDSGDDYEFTEQKQKETGNNTSKTNPRSRDTESVWEEHDAYQGFKDTIDSAATPGVPFG